MPVPESHPGMCVSAPPRGRGVARQGGLGPGQGNPRSPSLVAFWSLPWASPVYDALLLTSGPLCSHKYTLGHVIARYGLWLSQLSPQSEHLIHPSPLRWVRHISPPHWKSMSNKLFMENILCVELLSLEAGGGGIYT